MFGTGVWRRASIVTSLSPPIPTSYSARCSVLVPARGRNRDLKMPAQAKRRLEGAAHAVLSPTWNDSPNQADQRQSAKSNVGDIEFPPPTKAVRGTAGVGMVVVVPAVAIRREGEQPVVTAVLVGVVVPIAPHVAQRIYSPGNMPGIDGSINNAEKQQAQPELDSAQPFPEQDPANQETGKVEQQGVSGVDPNPQSIAFQAKIKGVAEDVTGIVFVAFEPAQLAVFDQQPAHVSPKPADQRAVGVGLQVGVLVMKAVDHYPTCRGVLQRTNPQQRKDVFEAP